MGNDVKLFEGNRIRSIWNNEKEEWYFSIIDVVNVLTDSKNPRRYWSDLKRKMKEEELLAKKQEELPNKGEQAND